MALWKKLLVGAVDMLVDSVGGQMSSIERTAKSSGRDLNNDFYERKDSYERIRNDYKSRREDMDN